MTGKAIINPANAPTKVDVVAEEETKQAEGSHPAKVAYAKPAKLPIAVNIIVVFISRDYYKIMK